MVISGPHNRKRRTAKRLLMVTIVFALLSPAACGSQWPGQETPQHEIKLAGHIEATETDLAFQVPGRIASIAVEAGEEVKAGQVVAKLDDQVFRYEVDAAQGRVEAADATPRPKKLKDAELRQARAALELARLRLQYATLTAPVGGLVLAKSANPGEVAAVGTTIITLGDLDHVWFEGYLPEKDLGKVRYGQTATITVDCCPGEKFSGTISYISAKAEFTPKTVETYRERVTMVYRVRIKLPNPKRVLKVGMPAEAVISLDKK
jgi:multidrug resistance efflux pump